jgi:kynurenine formamidase
MIESEALALFDRCSNWGRWGQDDELGTLNYITPDKRVAAARLVKTGYSVALGQVAGELRSSVNPNPPIHRMLYVQDNYPAYVDSVDVAPHGWAMTHLDALGHFSLRGDMYNGRRQDTVVTNTGLTVLSVAAQRNGIFTRGVLLDVARASGRPFLEVGEGVSVQDLEAAEHLARTRVGEGDAVIVRIGTGISGSANADTNAAAGLLPECIVWLHERKVSVYSGDCQEMRPSGYPNLPEPLHQIGIVSMGLSMLDVPNVELLAAAVTHEGRADFLLTCAPVPFPKATGAAVNPLCIF